MKKILRFQLKDLIYSCLVYALVMLLLSCIPAVISITFGDIDTNINGNGLPGAVFCLVFGCGGGGLGLGSCWEGRPGWG